MGKFARSTELDFENLLRDECSICFPELETIIDWIRANFAPEDTFSKGELEEWANANSFEKAQGQ